MAAECDLCLIVVESNVSRDDARVLEGLGIDPQYYKSGELRFIVQHKTVWRYYNPPDMLSRATADPYENEKLSVEAWSEEVNKKVEELMKLALPKAGHDLEVLGRRLWHSLVPEGLRDDLKKVAESAGPENAPVLVVRTHLDWIPWEIMRMEHDYLGVRFQIARMPLLKEAHETESEPRTVESIYNLLGRDALRVTGPAELTDNLRAAWKTMFSFIDPQPHSAVVHKRSPPAEKPNDYPDHLELKKALTAKDAHIVHITCKGLTKGGTPYWTLDEQPAEEDDTNYEFGATDVELPEVMEGIGKHRPFVFANACGRAKTGRYLGGFGPCFMRQGALAFVDTFATINTDLAVRFACEFYKLLLTPEDATGNGMSIGRALWQTKRHFLGAQEPDPSYLFYRLYGVPETRFKLNTGQ